jgi:predicted glycogen debranching enzyme
MFGPGVCGDLAAGTEREWLVTDGLGGYAMGTVSGLRTRRYHGLLMVAGQPPTRRLAVASLDPVVTLPSGATVRLGAHEWASGAVSPAGHELLAGFDLIGGVPRWRWRIGDVLIERELAMTHGRAVIGVTHRVVSAPAPVELAIEALCTWRDSHGERYADGGPLAMEPTADGTVIEGAYRLAGPGWHPAGEWWFGVWARQEAERGLNPREDLWLAGRFHATVPPGEVIGITAWAGDLATAPPPATEIVAAARARARRVVAAAGASDSFEAALALAADAFIVSHEPVPPATPVAVAGGPGGPSRVPDVIAGYPWFGTWSRDTMTAYEGLFCETGRMAEGRELLLGYADTISEGMLANTADTGRTEYNTADATLWFLHALNRHVTRTGDTDLARALVGRLDEIVAAHSAGTRYGIRVDPADGLLTQGAPNTALTWMDARIDNVAVTPRAGKAVEINALWINGLAAVASLRERVGLDASEIHARANLARTSFRTRFPAPEGWLYDLVDGPEGADATLRPNQLLAYALPAGPVRGQPVPLAVRAALFTPLGPRSRARGDGGYRGQHRGNSVARDLAYHQGTVWPWLIGPYVDAVARSRGELLALLGAIEAHLSEWGLGSVSETADGDPPHRATGCPFQAWSVAEVLRIRRLAP